MAIIRRFYEVNWEVDLDDSLVSLFHLACEADQVKGLPGDWSDLGDPAKAIKFLAGLPEKEVVYEVVYGEVWKYSPFRRFFRSYIERLAEGVLSGGEDFGPRRTRADLDGRFPRIPMWNPGDEQREDWLVQRGFSSLHEAEAFRLVINRHPLSNVLAAAREDISVLENNILQEWVKKILGHGWVDGREDEEALAQLEAWASAVVDFANPPAQLAGVVGTAVAAQKILGRRSCLGCGRAMPKEEWSFPPVCDSCNESHDVLCDDCGHWHSSCQCAYEQEYWDCEEEE